MLIILTTAVFFLYGVMYLFYLGNLTGNTARQDRLWQILILIVNTIAFAFFYNQRLPLPFHWAAWAAALTAECFILYKITLEMAYWAVVTLIFTLLCARGISVAILSLLSEKSMMSVIGSIFSDHGSILIMCILQILFTVIFNILFPDDKIRSLVHCKSQLRFFNIVESILLLYQLLATCFYYYDVESAWLAYFHLAGCILVLMGACVVLDRAIKFSQWIQEEIKTAMLEEQLKRQLTHYSSYQHYMKSFRVFKKEYNELMGNVRHAIQISDKEGALRLLSRADDQIHNSIGVQKGYSNHMLIDAVLQSLSQECKSKGIYFEGKIFIPDWIRLTDLDICRVFSNICRNAVEACEKMTGARKRYIKISGSVADGWLTIAAENTFTEEIIVRNGAIVTSKKNKELHGIGISSVRQIVEAAGGVVNIDIDKELQLFKISLHICGRS